MVIDDDAGVTFTGSGKRTGNGSFNKAGVGTVILNTENTYLGATVAHEGTIQFSTLNDVGVASGIGASHEFAQSWIWNGGIWRYMG